MQIDEDVSLVSFSAAADIERRAHTTTSAIETVVRNTKCIGIVTVSVLLLGNRLLFWLSFVVKKGICDSMDDSIKRNPIAAHRIL